MKKRSIKITIMLLLMVSIVNIHMHASASASSSRWSLFGPSTKGTSTGFMGRTKSLQEIQDEKDIAYYNFAEKAYQEVVVKYMTANLEKIRQLTGGNRYTSGIIEKS